jgi:regulator of protease activity HflC (stomatin/prohibitin superfamily)
MDVNETRAWSVAGLPVLGAAVVLAAGVVAERVWWHMAWEWWALDLLALVLAVRGLFVVAPNEARAVVFFGRYVGSVRMSGLYWTNPFTVRRGVSLRVRNFLSDRLKVNDAAGNPVEIAAVVVWRVVDSGKALFAVEDYAAFVAVQAETAIRTLAARYPYDGPAGTHSLRSDAQAVAVELRDELEARLAVAGVTVLEARLTHLAYAPEIAPVMLRRQQAEAVVAARETIVAGAVGMVRMALEQLSKAGVVDLDEERKAAMANNLMVVLTADQAAQPVVNAGSLYA